jgi:hypothetical protein
MAPKMEAPQLGTAAASGVLSYDGDGPEDNHLAFDLQACRALWWRLLCQGLRLPAERGVIIVRGGRS